MHQLSIFWTTLQMSLAGSFIYKFSIFGYFEADWNLSLGILPTPTSTGLNKIPLLTSPLETHYRISVFSHDRSAVSLEFIC